MPLRKLFWLLSVLTVGFLVVQALGYNVLDIIISLLLIDLIVVEISRQEDRHHIESRLKPELMARIGNMERLCSDMLSSMNALPTVDHFYHIAEEKIGEQRSRIKEEVKEDLDRLAKKAIDIENRLFDLKRSVASGIGSIDNRLRAIETGRWVFYADDETKAEAPAIKAPAPASKDMIYGENVIE